MIIKTDKYVYNVVCDIIIHDDKYVNIDDDTMLDIADNVTELVLEDEDSYVSYPMFINTCILYIDNYMKLHNLCD